MNFFKFSKRSLPLLLQDHNGECGVACLAMIAGWHGHRLSLDKLRETYPTTRRGLSLADLATIADQLRLDVRGLKVADPDQLAHVRLPAILHWDRRHFVVLKEVRRDTFVIHDPAVGVRRYSRQDLAEHFSGSVMEIETRSAFEAIVHEKRYPLRRILERTSGLKTSLAQIIAVALVGALVTILIPVLVQIALDSVLPRADLDLLTVLAFGVLLVMLTTAATGWLRARIVANAGGAFFAQLTRNAVGHIFRLPLTYFEKRHPGDIATRLESIDFVRNTVSQSVVTAVLDLVMILLSGTVMFLYAPELAAVITALFLIVVVTRLAFLPSIRRQGAVALQARSEERSRLIDGLRCIAAVKSIGAGFAVTSRWYDSLVRQLNARFRIQVTQANAMLLVDFVTAVGTAVTLYYGVGAVVAQKMTVGMLYAFFTYRSIFFERIDSLVATMTDMSMLGANMRRLSDFLEAKPEPSWQAVERPIRSGVRLAGVGFRAGFADQPIIADIDLDLDLQQARTIAILGPSGSGKTTLLKVIAALYPPSDGQLLVDSVPVDAWGMEAYRRNIGLLLGTDRLMQGTIAENVCMFSMSPDLARAKAALRVACLDDVVDGLPLGINTIVSEENGVLSSGQRRRLMLARALYPDPPLLLLDEVTSNLDAETSDRVLANLVALPATKVITSHSRAVLRRSDAAFSMEAGRLRPVDPRSPAIPAPIEEKVA